MPSIRNLEPLAPLVRPDVDGAAGAAHGRVTPAADHEDSFVVIDARTLPIRCADGGPRERPRWAPPPWGPTHERFVRTSRLAVLHGMQRGEVYRNGQNSWSPTGWRDIEAAPLRIADERGARRTTSTGTIPHAIIRRGS